MTTQDDIEKAKSWQPKPSPRSAGSWGSDGNDNDKRRWICVTCMADKENPGFYTGASKKYS